MLQSRTTFLGSRKCRLLSASTLALMAAAGVGASPSWAQSTATPPVETVEVTGTLITTAGYQAPTPMTVVGLDALQSTASSNIAQMITELPSLNGNITTQGQVGTGVAGTAGINAANLRNLGANRTLTLLDGHRIAPVNQADIVDINVVPQQLVKRVDVVTGGASATYGSDAVGGVLNFVLDKTFTGFKSEVAAGETDHGDAQNIQVSVTAGLPFAGDKGHFLVSGQGSYDTGISAGARVWAYLGNEQIGNPAYVVTGGVGNGQPQNLVLFGAGNAQSAPGGLIFTGPLRGTYFGQGGQPGNLNFGSLVSGQFMKGGDWQYTDLRPTGGIAPVERRDNIFTRASYDVTDHLNVYLQLSYTSSYASAAVTSPYLVGTTGPTVQIDNAYLPASVRTAMQANKITSFVLGTFNTDLGTVFQNTKRTQLVYQIGASGDVDLFGSSWKWDAYAQDTIGDVWLRMPQNISVPNYMLASDAVVGPNGQIVCRSTLANPTNGCAPIDVMGLGVNAPNSPGVKFVNAPDFQHLLVGQVVYGAKISGSPFSDWAGPVSMALDVEYRDDINHATVDPVAAAAGHVYGNYGTINGSERVAEGAVELAVPIARDLAFAKSLDLSLAARYAGYNLFGDALTWKVGATWSPIDDVKFRFVQSRDIRAPNISEAFATPATAKQTLPDPANNNASVTYNQITQGNIHLTPEKADTTGAGMVFQPSFLPGFSASIDYFETTINNTITTLASTTIVNLCFNGSQPQLCQLITRQGGLPNGTLLQVISTTQNFAYQHVSGIDYEASYSMDLANLSSSLPGSLNFHVNVSQNLEDITNTRLAPPTDAVGNPTEPYFKFLASANYDVGAFRGGVTVRGFSDGFLNPNGIMGCAPTCPTSTSSNPTYDNDRIPSATYIDLNFSYNFDLPSNSTGQLFFNVRNLTDVDPFPTGGNFFTDGVTGGAYDVAGRVYRLGFRFNL